MGHLRSAHSLQFLQLPDAARFFPVVFFAFLAGWAVHGSTTPSRTASRYHPHISPYPDLQVIGAKGAHKVFWTSRSYCLRESAAKSCLWGEGGIE